MPFEGRNLNDVSTALKDHLNQVLSHTITRTPLVVWIPRRSDVAWISFRIGGRPSTTTLQTRFGSMDLFLGLACDVVSGQHDRVRLRLISYRYTLSLAGANEALLRWEYDRIRRAGSLWCQHHLQGAIDLLLGGSTVSLNAFHLPTGPVPIEEVIRFLIVDLGVPPLDPSADDDGTPGWHRRLTESASIFSDG